MFDRKELLQSKEYWVTRIQSELYALLESYMKEKDLNRSQLADELGVTKGYVSQVLNGDFDHRISKLIELSLKVNKVPRIFFEDIKQVLDDDQMGLFYEKSNTLKPQIHLKLNLSDAATISELHGDTVSGDIGEMDTISYELVPEYENEFT